MAGRSTNSMAGTTQAAKTTSTKTKEKELNLELNLDKKVSVKNLAGWKVTFARLHDGVGDVVITEDSKTLLSSNEIQAQINNGNRLFIGTDGNGSHATLFIDDEDTRKWVGFESDETPQLVFTDGIANKLFDMTYNEFEKRLPEYIVTRAEKYALIEAIKRLQFNDYRKMVLASNYTGYKI